MMCGHRPALPLAATPCAAPPRPTSGIRRLGRGDQASRPTRAITDATRSCSGVLSQSARGVAVRQPMSVQDFPLDASVQ